MSDVDYDLAEILKSPLEPDPGDRSRLPWPAMLAAFALGAAVAASAVGTLAAADGPDTTIVAPATTRPAEAVVADPAPFPDGYVPITSDVAVRAEAPLREPDRLLVPMTMVVRRDASLTEVGRPLGGRWELRTGQGIVESQRIVYDPFLPSVFSVEFPLVDTPPDEIVMVERWDGRGQQGSLDMEWPGVPFRTDDPIAIDAGGSTLRIVAVDLGNFIGKLEWSLDGPAIGLADIDVLLLDDDGGVFGEYLQISRRLDPEPSSGFHEYFWRPGFRVDQDDAVGLRFVVNVVAGTPAAVEIPVPLPG